jgi:hypothetical protein
MQNDFFEKIELYLHNELEGEDQLRFEEELKTNKELREHLALYKTIDDEMRQKMPGSEEGRLKETLKTFNKKYFNKPGTSAKILSLTKRRRTLFAAAAMLLLLTGAYWVFLSRNSGSEKLYARYARYQSLSLQRGNDDTAKILQDAIADYNNREFKSALTGLNIYLQKDSSDAELVLAKNICLTETGMYVQASKGFDNLAAKNEIFKSQALWYKALLYLKQGNKGECKKILESISEGSDIYTKAKALLKEL